MHLFSNTEPFTPPSETTRATKISKRLNSSECQCTDANLSMAQLNAKHLILLVSCVQITLSLSPQTSNTSPKTLKASFLPSLADVYFV